MKVQAKTINDIDNLKDWKKKNYKRIWIQGIGSTIKYKN